MGRCKLFLFMLKLYPCSIRLVYACMVTNIYKNSTKTLKCMKRERYSIALSVCSLHGVYNLTRPPTQSMAIHVDDLCRKGMCDFVFSNLMNVLTLDMVESVLIIF